MANTKALSVILSQELFDKYLDVDFTCEEYLAAAQREDSTYVERAKQGETQIFSLTDEQYDEILESQIGI